MSDTNCKTLFLFEKTVLKNFNIIGTQYQSPITFCSDLVKNKTLEAINSTPTHMNF